jgi:hypothetical protein
MNHRLRSLLVAHGALIFLVGLAAGFPFAMILLAGPDTPPPVPGDVRGWRMAHLEGVLNGLTLIGVAGVGRDMVLTQRAQVVLFWSLVITGWGNIVASIIGPLFGGRGLTFGGGIANSLMFLLFTAAVFAVIVAMIVTARGAWRAAR